LSASYPTQKNPFPGRVWDRSKNLIEKTCLPSQKTCND
jgi:hypothetical protein